MKNETIFTVTQTFQQMYKSNWKKVVVLKIDILRVGNVYTIILCNKT